MEVFVVGNNRSGQIGASDPTEESIKFPQTVPIHSEDEVSQIHVQKVACGFDHTVLLSADGKVYSTGNGTFGQLGSGRSEIRGSYQQLDEGLGDHRIVDIACGWEHSIFLNDRGEMFSCGSNEDGQLGLPNIRQKTTPTLLEDIRHIAMSTVEAACYQSASVSTTGHLYTWGSGQEARLGHGNRTSFSSPKRVELLREQKIASIAFGSEHGLALSESGSVYSWGSGFSGQLGHGAKVGENEPRKVESVGGVVRIAAGDKHSAALTQNGELYLWGENVSGKLGLGSNSDIVPTPSLVHFAPQMRVKDVSCGGEHTMCISVGGELFSWGLGSEGQLGFRCQATQSKPRKVSISNQKVKAAVCGRDFSLIVTEGSMVSQSRTMTSPQKAFDAMDDKENLQNGTVLALRTPTSRLRGLGSPKTPFQSSQSSRRRPTTPKTPLGASQLTHLHREVEQLREILTERDVELSELAAENRRFKGFLETVVDDEELDNLESAFYHGLKAVTSRRIEIEKARMQQENLNSLEKQACAEREKRDLQELIHCKICSDSNVKVVLLPCRHLCVCGACSERVDTCPMCRAKIEDKMEIFQ